MHSRPPLAAEPGTRLRRAIGIVLVAAGLLAVLGGARGARAATPVIGRAETRAADEAPGVRLGLGFFGTSYPGPDDEGDLEPAGWGELRVGLELEHGFTVGLSHLGYEQGRSLAGTRRALSGGPFVEAAPLSLGRFTPFVQVGLPFQYRFDAGIDPALGIAPYLSAGMRLAIWTWMSVGLETRAHFVSSDGFLLHRKVLPEGAVPVGTGLNLDFHL